MNSLLHQIEFTCNLLIVASCKYFVKLLHGLVKRIYVLSLGLNFVVEFKGSCDYVFGLDDKIVKVLLLISQCRTSRTLCFIESFLDHLQTLNVYQLAKLLITKRCVFFK